MKTRTKAVRFLVGDYEIKAKDDSKRTFEGTLSTSHLDLGDGWARDIVHPGAFKRTLDHFRNTADPYVPLVDGHNYGSVFNVYGHMLEGEEVLTGQTLKYELEGGGFLEVPEMKLRTEWQVIDGIDGERLLDRMRPSSVRKMSMGYVVYNSDDTRLKDYGPVRNLREVGLREGSLVVFGMNPNAGTDPSTIKSLADALREGTLTEEEKAELRALLDSPPAADTAPEPKGLAPEDPEQIRRAEMLRALTLRSLAA